MPPRRTRGKGRKIAEKPVQIFDILRVELPLPAHQLSPNARVHYQVRARATSEAKDMVVCAVLEQRERGKPLAQAIVTVSFVLPDQRRRDHQNLIAGSKAYVDGLVLAGIIEDDDTKHIQEIYPPPIYKKGVGKTIIEVTDAL